MMIRNLFFIVIILCSGCAQNYTRNDGKDASVNAELKDVFTLRDQGVLTFKQAANRAESIVRSNFPRDSLMIEYYASVGEYSEAYDEKRIDKDKYRSLVEARWARYLEASERRNSEYTAQQRSFQNQATINSALDAAAVGVNRSIQQQQRPQNCMYSAAGNSVVQSCF